MKNELTQRIRAILHDRQARRSVMLWLTLLVIALAGLGATVMDAPLADAPMLFLGFWGLVFFLTTGLFLLGLYDLLRVRQEMRRENVESEES